MKASRLIELLAQHIYEHGDTDVIMKQYTDEVRQQDVTRCWWDYDDNQIVVGVD